MTRTLKKKKILLWLPVLLLFVSQHILHLSGVKPLLLFLELQQDQNQKLLKRAPNPMPIRKF